MLQTSLALILGNLLMKELEFLSHFLEKSHSTHQEKPFWILHEREINLHQIESLYIVPNSFAAAIQMNLNRDTSYGLDIRVLRSEVLSLFRTPLASPKNGWAVRGLLLYTSKREAGAESGGQWL